MYFIYIVFQIAIIATARNIEFHDNELTFNSSCLIRNTRQPGTCININYCPSALSALPEVDPETCFLENHNPVVCCPDTEKITSKIIDRQFYKHKITNMCYDYYVKRGADDTVRGDFDEHGLTNDDVPLVSHGTLAPISEHMYTATLGWRRDDNSYDFRCGAFLVARNYVLTAAHCMRSSSPDIVRLGDKIYSYFVSQDLGIANISIHPDYKPDLAYNDIAIVKLSEEADERYILACLWEGDPNLADYLIATGFGATEYNGPTSDFLYEVRLDLMNNTVCDTEFSGHPRLVNGMNDTQLCAGDPERRRDSCQGDSGGPLFTKMNSIMSPDYKILNGITHVIGITSFGQVCGQSLAAVYTKVSSYLQWIDTIIFDN